MSQTAVSGAVVTAKSGTNTAATAVESASRFSFKYLLPLAAVLISLAAEVWMPNHEKLRNPDYKQFQILLVGLFGMFLTLGLAAIFEDRVRPAFKHPAALTLSSAILLFFVLSNISRFGASTYKGFQTAITVVAFLLAIAAVASWFVPKLRERIGVGWTAGALTLALLIIIMNHNALAELSASARGAETGLIILTLLALVISITFILVKSLRVSLARRGWFIFALIFLVGFVNVVTAKLMLLPQIYFPSISRIIHVYQEEFEFLFLQCLVSSFVLLIQGVLTGMVVGVITGVLVGWSKRWNYWVNPLVRILGPIPTSTWIPLALVAFSTPRAAAIFVIAFGVWFQISILTASGIMNVKKTYYEVSSTLGATDNQNLFYIAIPDALPSIFLGLFNATCSSFAALVVAEMLGVKNGIGWYINWQKEMLSYPGVFAGLYIIAGFCYLFITVQFKLRDRLLSWQKGVIKW
jgi:NitT/TauT family transport system permease protein